MRYLTKLDVKREAKNRTFPCGTNTRNPSQKAKKKKKPLGSSFDFVRHVSSDSQHADVSYFTLFMVKRNSKVLRFGPINKCTFVLT